ncbi:hypothetical protein IQ37_19665, partial [Chryseobacterium piperi]
MKRYLFLVVNLFLFNCFYSQDTGGFMPKVVSPPPSVMEMEKYTTYDVNLLNGVASFDIPLYTLKAGDINIPITLNYRTAGIRYNQQPGEVGLGWQISPTYLISRIVNGRADEAHERPSEEITNSYLSKPGYHRDTFLSSFSSFSLGAQPLVEQYDNDFDIFSFNLLDSNGEFLIDNLATKKIASTQKAVKFNYELGNINNQSNYKAIQSFNAVDKNGIKYYFGKDLADPNAKYHTLSADPPAHTQVWYVSKIVDTKNNFVNFSYKTNSESRYNSTYVFTVSESVATKTYYGTVYDALSSDIQNEVLGPQESLVVDRMTTSNGQRIEYDRDGSSNRIKSIKIYDNKNTLIRKVDFIYKIAQKIFLEKVHIYDGIDPKAKTYVFSYYDENVAHNKRDLWGYYNDEGIPDFIFPRYVGIVDNITLMDAVQDYNTTYDIISYNISQTPLRDVPGFPAMEPITSLDRPNHYYSLKSIKFPTGGIREFEYEAHKYKGYDEAYHIENADKFFGMRIKRIISRDREQSTPNLIKEYRYGSDGSGYGNPFEDFSVSHSTINESSKISISEDGTVNTGRVLSFTNQNPFLGLFNQLGYIYYPKVTEYSFDKIYKDFNAQLAKDKTEYYHREGIAPNYYAFLKYSTHFNNYGNYYGFTNLSGGIEKEDKRIYYMKDTNNNFVPIKKVEKLMGRADPVEKKGIRISPFYTYASSTHSGLYQKFPNSMNSFYNFDRYTIRVLRDLEKGTKTTDYYGSQELVTEVTKDYANADHLQPTGQKTLHADGSKTETLYRYAHEKGNQLMISKNMVGIPLETMTTQTIGNSTKTLSKVETIYPKTQTEANTKTSGLVLPTSVLSYDISNLSLPGITELTYDRYDSKGNIQQYTSKVGVSTTIIWGYNGTHPIAKIEGAKLSDITQSLITTIVNASNADAANPAQEPALITALDNFRKNSGLSNYQITT